MHMSIINGHGYNIQQNTFPWLLPLWTLITSLVLSLRTDSIRNTVWLLPGDNLQSHFLPPSHITNSMCSRIRICNPLQCASIPVVTRTFLQVPQPCNPLGYLNIPLQSQLRTHFPFHHTSHIARVLLPASIPFVTRTLDTSDIPPQSQLRSYFPFHSKSHIARVLHLAFSTHDTADQLLMILSLVDPLLSWKWLCTQFHYSESTHHLTFASANVYATNS